MLLFFARDFIGNKKYVFKATTDYTTIYDITYRYNLLYWMIFVNIKYTNLFVFKYIGIFYIVRF